MIRRDVVVSPEAAADLAALYDWIAAKASPDVALGYIDRLEVFVGGLDLAAERGARRDDVRDGLRTVGFERRITIAFKVAEERVVILRFFYGGQDWEADLSVGDPR